MVAVTVKLILITVVNFAATYTFNTPQYSTLEQTIDDIKDDMISLSNLIHSTPEVGHEEHKAHENITNYLKKYIEKSPHESSFKLTPSAYNIPTAFEIIYSSQNSEKGATVGFNSEYDALPQVCCVTKKAYNNDIYIPTDN